MVSQKSLFSDADYIVVPFENSAFFEKKSQTSKPAQRRSSGYIDYDVWKNVVQDDTERRRRCSQPMTGSFLFRNITGTTF